MIPFLAAACILTCIATQPDKPFTYAVREINASIRIVSATVGAPASKEDNASHSLTVRFSYTPVDLTSMYVIHDRDYRAHAEDRNGQPFLRSNPINSQPPLKFTWLNTPNLHPSAESGKARGFLRTHNSCNSTPDTIGLFRVRCPIWRVVEYEQVELAIPDQAEWINLPNGSRVKIELVTEDQKPPVLSIYRIQQRDESGKTVPPPFQIDSLRDSDGKVIKSDGLPRLWGHRPEDPSMSHRERTVEHRYTFSKRMKELPAKITLNVVHEYELLDIDIEITDFPLGLATPHLNP